jgi:RNA-directed DNA polymerase
VSPKDARRQKPEQLGLPLEARGEAPSDQRSGEASTLANGEVRSGSNRLMEQVVARGNVRAALARVRENRGSPGVDGMTVEELPQYLMEHWEEVCEQLLSGTYQGSVRNFVCERLVVNSYCIAQQSPIATA